MTLERRERSELDPGLSIASEALLALRKPVVVSNRGPVQFRMTREGLKPERGPGGVVTALSSVLEREPILIAFPMTEGDRIKAAGGGTPEQGESQFSIHFVNGVSEKAYRLYYGQFSNPVLWFLQHGMETVLKPRPSPDSILRAFDEGYASVNREFAETVIGSLQALGEPEQLPVIMLQDYHLYLVPALLRQRVPEGTMITHFTHIPWPEPEHWNLLPEEIRTALLRGLTAADIAGFQTESYRQNFLKTTEKFLPGALVSFIDNTVQVDGHKCHTGVYPISIDLRNLQRLAASEEVAKWRSEIAKETGEMTIVRVDRIDPSKNIVRGFKAFDHLLELHPEYHGRLRFLAFLVPSRKEIPEYQDYHARVRAVVKKINQRYPWQPVKLFDEADNYPRAIAAMQLYDVLLVNPLADGMNLVSKEGPIVNQNNGVLVLSEGAGSAAELGEGAILVNPLDIRGTASALHEALQLPQESRARRNDALRKFIRSNNIYRWWDKQFRHILEVAEEKRRTLNSR